MLLIKQMGLRVFVFIMHFSYNKKHMFITNQTESVHVCNFDSQRQTGSTCFITFCQLANKTFKVSRLQYLKYTSVE